MAKTPRGSVVAKPRNPVWKVYDLVVDGVTSDQFGSPATVRRVIGKRTVKGDKPMRDDVTITIHQPPKCGFHATAIDADGRCAVARGTFGEGYPTEALARAAVRRRIRAMQRADQSR